MKTRSPRKSDPWLSPRQAAELLLDHNTFPRTTLEIRTLQKQICTTGRPGRRSMDAAKQTAFSFVVTSALWLSIFAMLSWAFPPLSEAAQ